MALFFGEFDQFIDGTKHRLAIPAALRESISPEEDGTNFILVLGPDRHLWMYPELSYARVLKRLQRNPLPNRKSQQYGLYFAFARTLKPDSQGRVVLPEKSMQRAVVAEKVTLVGKGDHIEIWPMDEWDKHVEESLPRYGDEVLDAGDGMDGAEADDK